MTFYIKYFVSKIKDNQIIYDSIFSSSIEHYKNKLYDVNREWHSSSVQGVPKKRTFRTEAASSTALAPVREAAHLLGDR